MFKIEFIVDDKHVARALQTLVGIAKVAPTVTPIMNGVVTNGKLRAESDGSIADMFMLHLKKRKLRQFRPSDVKDFLRDTGFSPDSSSYLIQNLKKNGLVRRTGSTSASTYFLKAK